MADPTLDSSLDGIARDYWEGTMRSAPRWATQLGDHRYDDRLEDLSLAAKDADRARLEALRRSLGDITTSSFDERVTLEALRDQIASDLDQLACPQEEWTIDPLEGPQVDLLEMAEYQDATTPEERSALLSRWRAIGPYLEEHAAALRRGLSAGRVGTRDAAIKVVAQLDELLARPIEDWPLVATPLAEKQEASFADELTRVVRDVVRPGYEKLRALVREELLPRTRGEDRVGLCFIDGGADVYRRLIRVHTSLDLAPEEIHATGLAEVARVRAEIEELGARVLGERGFAAVRERLAKDPAMFFGSRDAVRVKAEETLRRAEAAVPSWFGRLPRTPCIVEPMQPHEEKFSTIAFYRPSAADGSRPGTYLINTWMPETRPRYEAQALAFHEAVPGHHLQIALAQELPLPDFRKNALMTAYVEGWALYTERLADEMGLYDSDLDRLGMLSFDAWRACRLVVDTGMHALGWSRSRAIDYMKANTLLATNNVENEIDRYIVWPGQALAYKTGQLAMQKLRDEMKTRDGARFDVRRFHDRVLGVGPVGLRLLRECVLGA